MRPHAVDAMWLDLTRQQAQRLEAEHFLSGPVHIIGTFQNVSLEPTVIRRVNGDPHVHAILRQPQGFGGGYASQITHITDFERLSHR